MPAMPVTYSELYGSRPTEEQLSELIASFRAEPTFISLAMWNLMLSLSEGNVERYKYLQGFFIHNLIRAELRERVFELAALDSESARPVFGRWQLLALMKCVLLESVSGSSLDPRIQDIARRSVGDACLMLNDLLFPEEQQARFELIAGDREKISDELMTQWLFQSELYHPPDVYQAVARNDEYFDIFERRASEFRFHEQTLSQKFAALTGLEIRQYLRLYFSIYALHANLQSMHPDEINANPSIINFDKERVFSLIDFSPEECEIFFKRILSDLASVIQGVKMDSASGRAWQFDFTTFRSYPLIYNSKSKQAFTCIAYPFLIEKLASGIYHTILNSWPENDAERARFQTYWGRVFEQFANERLGEEYPASLIADRFYANPYFRKKQSGALVEVSDAVLDYGESLILLEHKGGYLSLDEKYSDDVKRLLGGIAGKFGLDKGIKQLARSVERLFNRDVGRRDTFSQLNAKGVSVKDFTPEDVKRVRKVYPVIVVQDFSLTMGFVNRRLRLQFEEVMRESTIDSGVHVRPLSLITIENLEDVLEHLAEVSLIDLLDEYVMVERAPLSNFDEMFKMVLKRKGVDQRRYHWSLKKGEQFINSIMERFTKGES